MCMFQYKDGFSNDWLLTHLSSRAVGGVGLVIAEATAVEARGRITSYDLGIWDDAHIEPLQRITRSIRENGAVAGVQIAHAGRKAGSRLSWGAGNPDEYPYGWQGIAPSAIAFSEEYPIPHALTFAEMTDIRTVFRDAAVRAKEAGFEWLEVHAAHGYLLHQFLSPLSNSRTDQYGGSFKNRVRFVLEIIRDIRNSWPDSLPLTVRISATDWVDGGWTLAESIELSKLMKAEGVDLVDCSTGGASPSAEIPVEPGYQVPFAETVRLEAEILTAAVGLITEPAQADEIVRSGRADIVLLGRELLRDPYWTIRAAQTLGHPAPVPPPYSSAF